MFAFFKKLIKNYRVGDVIFLGKYPQKNSKDNSPIEWKILDIFEGVALLISQYAIIPSGYCDPKESGSIEWTDSLARKICNIDFYNHAFSESEKQVILKRTTRQLSINCEDNVFLLDKTDIIKYFADAESRLAIPTEYAKLSGCRLGWNGYERYTCWWLMPHYEQYNDNYTGIIYPQAVFHNGEIQYHSRNAYHSDFAIRPCIQIDLNAYKKLR